MLIFTLPWHSPAMKHKKTVANIFQWKASVTWPKYWHWFFFDFLGVIFHFSINIRIEVHFFVFALGNERTLVACKSLRSASRFTRFTHDLPYQNIRSLVHICRKLAASLRLIVAASLLQTRFSYANFFSGALFWPTMCGAQLPHTIIVCHKFAAHSCRALRCSAPIPPTPPLVYHPHCHFFFSSLPPGGVWEKM